MSYKVDKTKQHIQLHHFKTQHIIHLKTKQKRQRFLLRSLKMEWVVETEVGLKNRSDKEKMSWNFNGM